MDRNYIIKITGIAPRRVALRKESVDRNTFAENPMISVDEVALRKESVDRNLKRSKIMKNRRSRSPQGERG